MFWEILKLREIFQEINLGNNAGNIGRPLGNILGNIPREIR
jgi:hypothetical protein